MNLTNAENPSAITPASVEPVPGSLLRHAGQDSPTALGLPAAQPPAPGAPGPETESAAPEQHVLVGVEPRPRRREPARDSRLRKLRVILSELLRLEPEEIDPECDLSADLGADSLDLAELVMALEEEFDTEMTDAEAEQIQTVQDILDWLEDNAED